MLILSIDCAGHGCGVCVWRDGVVLAEKTEVMQRGQDQRLMPMIVDVLKTASVSFEQLDRIAVTKGPGSFTGLRIGLAAARGIGLAADKPVVGIDRFSIYREAHKGHDQLVIINSRRKELYCKFYPAAGAAHDATMMTAEEIKEFLIDKSNIVLSGDVDFNELLFTKQSGGIPLPPLREGLGVGEELATLRILSSPEPFRKTSGYIPTPSPSRKDGRGAQAETSEHIICAKLAAKADLQISDYLPRPLYIRAPDVTMPKNKTGMRVLTLNDAALLTALHAVCFPDSKWSLQQIQSSLSLATTRGWGLFDGGAVQGFILCQIIPDQSEILTLCVHPDYRRKGIGEQLVLSAAQAAKTIGSNLFLDVAADNSAALKLYEKMGFVQTGRRARYYQTGNGSTDAVLLTLRT